MVIIGIILAIMVISVIFCAIRKMTGVEIIVVLAIEAVIACILAPGIIKCCDEHTVTITVSDKSVKRGKGNEDDKYLVYTKEDTTYEITDSLFMGRFDSSDLYGRIEVGKTYECTVAGYRIPFLSMYMNIYEAKEVEND